MILLNWNSFSLTTSDSLNSSSCDVFRIDHSILLEQRTFHTAYPPPGVWGLQDKGTGESRGGTGNEVVMKIFQIQRHKTGLIGLGMKKTWVLFYFFSLTIWHLIQRKTSTQSFLFHSLAVKQLTNRGSRAFLGGSCLSLLGDECIKACLWCQSSCWDSKALDLPSCLASTSWSY